MEPRVENNDPNFDKRKALETFGSRSAFSAAAQGCVSEVQKTIAKLDLATESLNRSELLNTLRRLESGLVYLHAKPALTALRELQSRARKGDRDWNAIGEEVARLRQKLSALQSDLREGLGSRVRNWSD